MRPERGAFLTHFENARNRASWADKYYSGVFIPDFRTSQERALFNNWYALRMLEARQFLEDLQRDNSLSLEERTGLTPVAGCVEDGTR